MLFTLKTTRKAGGLQILCCQGIKVADHDFTLDALALKPSDFCNVRVKKPKRWRKISNEYETDFS
jgi:hypothetical protein